MATATKATKTFAGLRCPHCGGENSLSVQVETLVLECSECSDEVTRADVEAMIAKWTRLFGWLDSAVGPTE
jgi:Zn ribbon nucleic-acid-binding protein